uniref:Uncharacterized protein n=1 Tax=mine drainage metagenome TaxID=410659 RepID=E6QU47_9ZZZZ
MVSVHPRRRGEHVLIMVAHHNVVGSSPQARGTRFLGVWIINRGRFIPAGAGNTNAIEQRAPKSAVHPRRRGEHYCVGAQIVSVFGSSPQARGTLK